MSELQYVWWMSVLILGVFAYLRICINSGIAEFLIINQLDALISEIYFWNEPLHVSDSSSVHHHEFCTVHTAMVYVIQVCLQAVSKPV
jgi:hypothetical protein